MKLEGSRNRKDGAGDRAPAQRRGATGGGDPPIVCMECTAVRDLLHRYVEDELDSLHAGLVKSHMARCSDCRAERDKLEQERLWFLEVALDAPDLSENFRKKIVRRIERRQRLSRKNSRRNFFFHASGVAAALLAIVLATSRPVTESAGGRLEQAPGPVADAAGSNASEYAAGAHRAPMAPAPMDTVRPDGALRNIRKTLRVDGAANRFDVPVTPYLGQVVFAACKLGSPTRRTLIVERAEPCIPDPNLDGKMDLNDVAYSFQTLIGAGQPQPLKEHASAASNSESDGLCLESYYLKA